jgi:hypothetical protein
VAVLGCLALAACGSELDAETGPASESGSTSVFWSLVVPAGPRLYVNSTVVEGASLVVHCRADTPVAPA